MDTWNETKQSSWDQTDARLQEPINYETIPHHLLTPLNSTWCLWYTNASAKTTENFKECLIPVATVSTVEAFWALYSHCIRPSQLPRGTEYHLFREGIAPMWEDPHNADGGTLMIRLKRSHLDWFWEALILALIGEQLDDDVVGAVAGKRYADDYLSIWNRKYETKAQGRLSATLLKTLKLPENSHTDYKSHMGSLRSSVQQQHQQGPPAIN